MFVHITPPGCGAPNNEEHAFARVMWTGQRDRAETRQLVVAAMRDLTLFRFHSFRFVPPVHSTTTSHLYYRVVAVAMVPHLHGQAYVL